MGAQPSGNTVLEASAFESRPLAAVIFELERRHGWIVTYEDPAYESPREMEDVTARRGDGRFDQKVFAPRQKAFSLKYTDRDVSAPYGLLSSMLDQYHRSGARERFRLVRKGRVYHVIPKSSPDVRGVATERQSLLDARITIPPGRRRASDELHLAMQRIQVATGVEVFFATPVKLLDQTGVQDGAKNEVARDYLVRTLALTGQPLSWRLLCSAGSPRECAFNLHLAGTPAR
jgi:hypothetical protein